MIQTHYNLPSSRSTGPGPNREQSREPPCVGLSPDQRHARALALGWLCFPKLVPRAAGTTSPCSVARTAQKRGYALFPLNTFRSVFK